MYHVSIESIKHYTANNVERIASHNPSLQLISGLLQPLLATDGEIADTHLITDEIATQAIKFSATDRIPEVFTEDEVIVVHEAARRILEIAVTAAVTADEDTSRRLVELAKYLHPLLSQDSRTEKIGWDLEEYTEWYFATSTWEDRRAYAEELLADWGIKSN